MMENVITQIIDNTREGNAATWNDRISAIADAAHIPIENIDWVGTPKEVALRVFDYAYKNESLGLLAKIVAS